MDENTTGFLSLIIVIPLVNSVFDFLSYTVSKKLIQHLVDLQVRGGGILFIITVLAHIFVDLFFAVIIFILLSSVLVFSLGFYFETTIDKACDIVNLGLVIDGVKENPYSIDSLWILLLLATTLIPTAIHLSASILALVRNIIPRGARLRMIKFLRSSSLDPVEASFCAMLFSFSFIGAVLIIFLATYVVKTLIIMVIPNISEEIINITKTVISFQS